MFELGLGKRQSHDLSTGRLYTKNDDDNTNFAEVSNQTYWKYNIGDYGTNIMYESKEIYETTLIHKDKTFTATLVSLDNDKKVRSFDSRRYTSHMAVLLDGDDHIALHNFQAKNYNSITKNKTAILKALYEIYTKDVLVKTEEALKTEEEAKREEQFVNMGKEMKPELVELVEEEEDITLNVKGSTLQEKFISIVGELSELTESINQDMALGDNKELAESFVKARQEIEKLTSTAPGKVSGFIGKYFGDNQFVQKTLQRAKDIKTENDSIQKNINHLFGVIHSKYEKLVVTGESLQKTKALLVAQIDAMEKLLNDSNKDVSQYENQTDIPIRDLQLNTQIKASVEKYRQRLIKIDGAIMATQTTIIALGKELPAMKTDLTDEMAIGGLLSNVDDYQHMFQEIAELVSSAAESTGERTRHVITNLFDMQINDTYTMEYLETSAKNSKELGHIVQEKSELLVKKAQHDAAFVGEIVAGNSIEYARTKVKKLKA
jgi:hypothetical protein